MPLTRDDVAQLAHLLRPIATRVANSVARSVVRLVNDSTKMQLVQLGVLLGEDVEGAKGAEHFQPYGLASVPLSGAEGVVLFPNGDRSHPLVVTISDRRSRPTGGDPGDVTLYNAAGAKVRMLASGDIEVQPALGGEVRVAGASGTAAELATKQDLQILKAAIGSAVIAIGGGGAATITAAADLAVAALVPPVSPPTWPIGTKTLKAE